MMRNTPFGSLQRVMLLGNNEFSKEMETTLQRLGIEWIAREDVSPDTYAQLYDSLTLRTLIERIHPEIIVPLHTHLASEVLLQLETEDVTIIVPTARAIHFARTRHHLRRFAAEELELPTARYSFARNCNELQMKVSMGIGYPCVIKPNSFLGQTYSIANDPKELKRAWECETSIVYPDSGVVVESMLDVHLRVSVLTVRAQGISSDQVETHFCEPIGHEYKEGRYIGSWQPQRLAPHLLQKVQKIAKTLTEALGGTGLFEVECFIQGDRVWFNRISPFPTEKSLVTLMSQEYNAFELHSRAFLGKPITTTLCQAAASLVVFDTTFIQSMPETKLWLFEHPSSYGVGVLLATGSSTQEAQQRAALAMSRST